MRVLDITGLIEEEMWHYEPPIRAPAITQIASIEGETGWDAHQITLFTLTGTYLEAAAHLFPAGDTIAAIDTRRFVKPAAIFHLPDLPPRYPITPEDLISTGMQPEPGGAVLISTGWEQRWNQPRFIQDSPHFTTQAMEWMMAAGAAIVGGDMPCFDDPARPVGVNEILFRADGLLLAPLVNLRQVKMNQPLLVALPLKIQGVCGAPCRAILIELGG